MTCMQRASTQLITAIAVICCGEARVAPHTVTSRRRRDTSMWTTADFGHQKNVSQCVQCDEMRAWMYCGIALRAVLFFFVRASHCNHGPSSVVVFGVLLQTVCTFWHLLRNDWSAGMHCDMSLCDAFTCMYCFVCFNHLPWWSRDIRWRAAHLFFFDND